MVPAPSDPAADPVARLRASVHSPDAASEDVAEATEEILEHVRSDTLSGEQAVAALAHLRSLRFFDEIARIARALDGAGRASPTIRRYHAQALIEAKRFDRAIALLRDLVDTSPAFDREHSEALGLLARCFKQIYVDAYEEGDSALLEACLREAARYSDAGLRLELSHDQIIWHGINLAAVLYRGEMDRVPGMPRGGEWRQLAGRIQDRIASRSSSQSSSQGEELAPWDLATAGEAAIALGEVEKALEWLGRYREHQQTDAFMLLGTARQLREIWRFDFDGSDSGTLSTIVHAEALRNGNGAMDLEARHFQQLNELSHSDTDPADRRPEANPLGEWLQDLHWLKACTARPQAVVRIGVKGSHRRQGCGTGFVVRLCDLRPELRERLDGRDLGELEHVVLTCAHVVTNDPSTHSDLHLREQGIHPLAPEQAVVTFEAEGILSSKAPLAHAVEQIWTSPYRDLDATILKVRGWTAPAGFSPCPISGVSPSPAALSRIYLMGHPRGEGFRLSLHGSRFRGSVPSAAGCAPGSPLRLHYKTPSERGSSGSPAFTEDWEVIGIHRGTVKNQEDANGRYDANEALWIRSL